MNKVMTLFLASAAAVSFSGCCMMLEERPQPRIQEIVEKHQQNVNRKQELDILCDKAWVPVYIKGQEGVNGKNTIALPAGVTAYVEFSRDSKVSGFAGVNAFSGSYAVTAPNLLRFGALVSNLQAGPHLDYEMLFMAQLNDVDHFVLLKSGEIEFMKRNMLMMRCKPADLKTVKSKAKPKAMTPVPPEPKSNIAATADKNVKVKKNPALPTVEKTGKK